MFVHPPFEVERGREGRKRENGPATLFGGSISFDTPMLYEGRGLAWTVS